MKVLFVCSGNAYRSPVAEALLKKARPDWDVDSAGVDPAALVSDEAKKYSAIERADQYLKSVPEGLDDKELDGYSIIVAMKREHKEIILDRCKGCENKIVVWNIDDPYFLPHRHTEKVFTQIKEKVDELALNANNHSP